MIPNIKCKYCYSDQLVQLPSDVTCMMCACEQNLGNFIQEVNFYERVSIAEEEETKIYNSNDKTIIENILILLDCEQYEKDTNSLFYEYTSKNIIKTDERRGALYLACLHYVGAEIELREASVKTDIEYKSIINFTKKLSIYKGARNCQSVSSNKTFYRDISLILSLCPDNKKKCLRRDSLVMYDLIKSERFNNKFQSCRPNGISGAIFYYFFKKNNISIKLKDISCLLQTTDSTILNILRKINNEIKL